MTADCGRTSDAVVPGAEEPDPKGPTSASASGVAPLPVRAQTSDAVVPGAEGPDPKGPTSASASGVSPLPVRALHREAERARGWLESGVWRPDAADAEAAARVLARLTAPLPRRGAAWARARTVDRDRRLQRIWRSAVHHLDAGAVSPPAAALLAAVARAYVPWYGTPNPPPAAAAPRYPVPSGSAAPEGAAAHGAVTRDAADRPEAPPTDAGEALLPGLTDVFTALAAPAPPGTGARHPAAVPWRTRYAGRFRHYGRPARHVWTADTFRCPGCSNADGPWTVVCDWRRVTLGCPCGVTTDRHGLTFSEVFLVLPDA
ncbi:hypothetical protein ACFVVB_08790 [Streptomyces californicus]|uniref:hypothetical protein n=1 Tax=Streptomyces californicus TaxID=67351 RepID=UPI0036D7EE39